MSKVRSELGSKAGYIKTVAIRSQYIEAEILTEIGCLKSVLGRKAEPLKALKAGEHVCGFIMLLKAGGQS